MADSRKLKRVQDRIARNKKTMKRRNPVIEALLWKHGYSPTARKNMENPRVKSWLLQLNRESGNNPRTEDIEKFIQEYEAANPSKIKTEQETLLLTP